ncbi:rRNA adenine dimethyltransferase family protein [Streptomyces caniscabiei]|uniref:ribosomal RNA small subunit methyltransferase A n=1 Tax=Streptomyces caniscabiei TaxID=2746961 RepID=UPI0029B56503|nr:rRNA adenine dimethyltransferase family protein [Streptomyces caniscabiei]MDX2776061.1 rRNA adenine dimethyltransferase family protein [Streptomyces caniscabiei]
MKRLAHFSQYFLRSPRLVKELVGHTSITKNDLVYDIGAGSGVISSVLAQRCRQVVAVEAEPRTATKLRANMKEFANVKIYQGDFMMMPLPDVPYKIFANIPFHLSSPIVRRITDAVTAPLATYLIVQKQFANKLLPDSDRFTGQLGMLVGPWFDVRIRKRLQRTDFWPHPNVDTVLLEIIPRSNPLVPHARRDAYHRFTVECFSDPRKFAKMPLSLVGLPASVRPSQMKLKQWVALFEAQHIY